MKPSLTSAFTPALNNIRGNKAAPAAMNQALNKKTKPQGAIKQYGDKGYKPSNGTGVGY